MHPFFLLFRIVSLIDLRFIQHSNYALRSFTFSRYSPIKLDFVNLRVRQERYRKFQCMYLPAHRGSSPAVPFLPSGQILLSTSFPAN